MVGQIPDLSALIIGLLKEFTFFIYIYSGVKLHYSSHHISNFQTHEISTL